jgi:hypothetical protein
VCHIAACQLMRQSEDLRFGGALLEAALADYADLWGGSFLLAGSGTSDTLKRCAADHGWTRVGPRVARLLDPPGVSRTAERRWRCPRNST